MRRFRGILLLLLCSVVLWGSGLTTVRGCAEGPGYFDYQTIFFLSSLAGDPIYERFYFDRNHDRSEYQWDDNILSNRAAENLKEWQKYFGGKLGADTVKQLVYETPLKSLMNGPVSQKGEAWERFLMRPENRPALEYLIYAKRCEPYCTVDRWSWDIEAEMAKHRKPDEMRRLINDGKVRCENSKSIFLKQRYGYQIVRLAHYVKDYRLCIELFDHYLAPLKKSSIVWDWAARHRNGALLALDKKAEALLATSLMFDQNPKLMDEAYLDFDIPEEPVWLESLRLANHPHRKATLWMLRGFKEPRFILEPLQKMAQLEPKSPRVEVMLVRYINKLECNFFNSAYFFENHTSDLNEAKTAGLVYVRELNAYIASVDKMQFRQPALWYAAGAYLYIMDHQYAEARQYLTQAEALCSTPNSDLSYQIQLLKLLTRIVETPSITPEIENDSLSVISWLDAYAGQKNNREEIHDAFYTLLGQKYLAIKDFPKAYCCMAKAGSENNFLLEFYPTPAEMDQLLGMLVKTAKTPYEQVITFGLPLTVDDYLSVAGTQLFRKADYSGALAHFQKIPKSYWEKLRKDDTDLVETSFEENYYNPRTGLYRYPKNGMPRSTKLDFTRNIIALKEKAATDPVHADIYYYQIANGYFHSPFWGLNEQLWGCWSSPNYDGSFYPFDANGIGELLERHSKDMEADYGRREAALSYYVKAMNTTKDPELAAKCCFLAAACMTQFSFYNEFEEPGRGIPYYFDILRKKYSGTAYYQKVIRECATLQQYLKK